MENRDLNISMSKKKVAEFVRRLCLQSSEAGQRLFLLGSLNHGFKCFYDVCKVEKDQLLTSWFPAGNNNLPAYVFGALSYDDMKASALGNGTTLASSKIMGADEGFEWKPADELLTCNTPASKQALQQKIDELLTETISEHLYNPSICPNDTMASYIQNAKKVLDEIADGDYYQANILRYFTLKFPEAVTSSQKMDYLLTRWLRYSGPRGSIVFDEDSLIVSFSPETFVDGSTQSSGIFKLSTLPIKGTEARGEDEESDARQASKLKSSSKDNAELAMIVDLMRNDLTRLAGPGNVDVVCSPHVQSFGQIHHLVAQVEASLSSSVNFALFLRQLFPAGSITGAPKLAVMRRIRQLEGRERGFFMGNAFCWKLNEWFESTVLIRTAVVLPSSDTQTVVSYAAGSGLVIKSDPSSEAQEIWLKCTPVVDKP